MVERRVICIIGPQEAGKTTLLAAIQDGVDKDATGYPLSVKFTLTPQPSGEASQPKDRQEALALLAAAGQGEWSKLYMAHIVKSDDYQASEPDKPRYYHFSLDVDDPTGTVPPARDLPFTVADTAGELLNRIGAGNMGSIPAAGGEVEASPDAKAAEVRDAYHAALLSCDAILLVLPLGPLNAMPWVSWFRTLLDLNRNIVGSKLKHVVVVFSQYERMFTNLGPDAFEYACSPDVMQYVIRRALADADWLQVLGRLPWAAENGLQVHFTATSAFGFVKEFGNPNIDRSGNRSKRFGNGTGPAYNLWRPFLTADPFLFTILDTTHPYMFRLADLGMERPDLAAPEPLQPQPAPQPPPVWVARRDAPPPPSPEMTRWADRIGELMRRFLTEPDLDAR